MVRPKPSLRDGFIRPRTILCVRLLLVAAAAVAGYLALASLRGGGVAGCGPQSGCHSVLNSRWAYWFGIPVSFPALALYLLMIAGTVLLSAHQPAPTQRRAWSGLVPGAWMILAAAIWFIVLQAVVLHSFCPYCFLAHALGSAAGLLLLFNAPFRPVPEKPREQERQVFLAPHLARKFLFIGLLLAAGLVAGQTLYVRPGFKIQSVAAPVVEEKNQERTLQVFGGKFKLKLEEVPMIGSPASSNVMLSLFDYTCHHCRAMHPRLLAAQQLFSNRLAIVNLPMPLDERCNRTIRRGETPADHREACDQARLGLAVWRARRDRMAEFDEWMFRFQTVPPYTNAKAFAQRLVGPMVLEKALVDPWVSQQITNNVGIYATAYYEYKNGSMPQLIIGTNITSGVLSMERLFQLLDTQFHLRTDMPQTN